jgi:general secretion pathway protein D
MKHRLLLAFSLFSTVASAQELRMEVIDLRQVPLADAARILSETSGLNVVASVEAGKTSVSLYLTNVAPRAAIEALCRSHNLWFRDDEESGIIRIHTPEEYKRDLGSFQDELTEVFDMRFPNATDFGRAIRDLFGNRVRMNLDVQQDYQSTQELQQRFQRFDIVDGRSQQLGVGQTGSNGGGFNGSQSGLNGGGRTAATSLSSLVGAGQMLQNSGYRLPSGQTQAQSAQSHRPEGLSAEDIQSLQVQSSDERAAVVQNLLDERVDIFVTVIQRLNKVIVRTSDLSAMAQIKKLMTSVDVATPTVLLEVKILRVHLEKGYRSAVDYLFDDGITQAGFGTGAATTGDLSFRYAAGNFSARIQVMEEKGQVRVVSTPTLLIANNEVSRLFIGEERPLNRSFNGGAVIPGAANNVVVNGSTDIEFRPVGTTLLITPNINADKSVTLRLLQENSNINLNGASVLVPNASGFTRQAVDTVQSRTVSGTVVAKDHVPVVIGGLIDTNFTDTRAQVPLLGNIPLLGALFGKRQNMKTRDELVLLIFPHVVDPSDGGAIVTKEVLQSNEVQALESFATESDVNAALQSHLPAPAPPHASSLDAVTPKPRRRGLFDMLRRRH